MLCKAEVNQMVESVNSSNIGIEWEFWRKQEVVDCFRAKDIETQYQLQLDEKNERVGFSKAEKNKHVLLFKDRVNGSLKKIVNLFLKKPSEVYDTLLGKDGVVVVSADMSVEKTLKSVINPVRTRDYVKNWTDAYAEVIDYFEQDGDLVETVHIQKDDTEMYVAGGLILDENGEKAEVYIVEDNLSQCEIGYFDNLKELLKAVNCI